MSWWFATAGEAAGLSSGNYGITEVAGNLALAGGSHHVTVTRIHVAGNLALASGTYTVTKYIPVHEDAPNMQLTGGFSSRAVGKAETAALLSLLGGTQVISTGRYLAETAAHLSLLAGTHQVAIGRLLAAANLQLLGGDFTTTINVAAQPVGGTKVYTTDEPSDNLVGSMSRAEHPRLTRRTW